jgi:prophage regulatory protein
MKKEEMNVLLRMKDLKIVLGCCRATVYGQIKQGLLPKPIKLGERMVVWSRDEINKIIAARLAGYDGDIIKALVERLMTDRKTAIKDV